MRETYIPFAALALSLTLGSACDEVKNRPGTQTAPSIMELDGSSPPDAKSCSLGIFSVDMFHNREGGPDKLSIVGAVLTKPKEDWVDPNVLVGRSQIKDPQLRAKYKDMKLADLGSFITAYAGTSAEIGNLALRGVVLPSRLEAWAQTKGIRELLGAATADEAPEGIITVPRQSDGRYELNRTVVFSSPDEDEHKEKAEAGRARVRHFALNLEDAAEGDPLPAFLMPGSIEESIDSFRKGAGAAPSGEKMKIKIAADRERPRDVEAFITVDMFKTDRKTHGLFTVADNGEARTIEVPTVSGKEKLPEGEVKMLITRWYRMHYPMKAGGSEGTLCVDTRSTTATRGKIDPAPEPKSKPENQ